MSCLFFRESDAKLVERLWSAMSSRSEWHPDNGIMFLYHNSFLLTDTTEAFFLSTNDDEAVYAAVQSIKRRKGLFGFRYEADCVKQVDFVKVDICMQDFLKVKAPEQWTKNKLVCNFGEEIPSLKIRDKFVLSWQLRSFSDIVGAIAAMRNTVMFKFGAPFADLERE